jgi:hypothetical protein
MSGHTARPAIASMIPSPLLSGSAPVPPADGTSGPTAVDARIRSVLEIVSRELGKPQSVKHFAALLRLSP